jgi:hypothetical protein
VFVTDQNSGQRLKQNLQAETVNICVKGCGSQIFGSGSNLYLILTESLDMVLVSGYVVHSCGLFSVRHWLVSKVCHDCDHTSLLASFSYVCAAILEGI